MRHDPWVLVLAGGDGTRLQEFTRALTGTAIPKQYCRLLGDRSLLEATIARATAVTRSEHVLVVLNRAHLPLAREQLRTIPAENVLVQPRNCDTGPGIAFSLAHLARRDPAARCVVFPSDHWIDCEDVFVDRVRQALAVVCRLRPKIALLGIEPEHAEPGFGYIEPAGPVRLPGVRDAHRVGAFREKPSVEEATRLAARGGLWNSFVMAFELPTMLRHLTRLRPGDLMPMHALVERPEMADAVYHHAVQAWNFSSGFLARVPRHLVVLRARGTGWSDWGTPEAIARTYARLRRTAPWQTAAPAAATA